MSDHSANVRWTGNLPDGSGEVKAHSGSFSSTVRLKARTEGEIKGETTPEELIAGAHATCYTMMIEATLGKHKLSAERVETEATVSVHKVEGGLKITQSHLKVTAFGPAAGLDDATFQTIAQEAEAGCPVSNALRGNLEITVEALLG